MMKAETLETLVAESGQYRLYFHREALDSNDLDSDESERLPAFAWYDYLATKQGDSGQTAALCACVTEDGDDESGRGEGGHWPDDWPDEVLSEFQLAMLEDARQRGFPKRSNGRLHVRLDQIRRV